MFIDAHHHLWNLDAVEYPWLMAKGVERFFGDPAPIQKPYGVPEFRADMDGLTCVGSVHVQVGAAPGQEVAETRWLADQAQTYDLPSAIVAAADLASPDLPALLDAHKAVSARVRGVRHIVSRHASEDRPNEGAALLQSDAFQRGLQRLSDARLSFDLQLTPPLLEVVADVLMDFPDLDVALCHAGSPWDQTSDGLSRWRSGLDAIADLDRVTCKISGLGMFDRHWIPHSIAPIVRTVLEVFGADRTMWGSNFPVDSLYHDYAAMYEAVTELVPETARNGVFVETARTFYKLERVA
ncbi:MAG: amidohydrolase family protein [Pseudomonadota bacterium]